MSLQLRLLYFGIFPVLTHLLPVIISITNREAQNKLGMIQTKLSIINFICFDFSGRVEHLAKYMIMKSFGIKLVSLCCPISTVSLTQWFPTSGNLNAFGLQLPGTPANTADGEGFWEMQSKNTWVTQG